MELHLIRHGHHADGFRGGWSRSGLSDEGCHQVRQLATRLKSASFTVDTLISSDLPRAAQTAEAVGEALGLPVIYAPLWREVHNGLLAGMPEDEAQRRYPGLYWKSLAWDEPYPGGGESPKTFFERITKAMDHLCLGVQEGRIGPRVAVITHGGGVRAASSIITGQPYSNKQSPFPAAETSIHSFRLEAGRWAVLRQNDTLHLEVK